MDSAAGGRETCSETHNVLMLHLSVLLQVNSLGVIGVEQGSKTVRLRVTLALRPETLVAMYTRVSGKRVIADVKLTGRGEDSLTGSGPDESKAVAPK